MVPGFITKKDDERATRGAFPSYIFYWKTTFDKLKIFYSHLFLSDMTGTVHLPFAKTGEISIANRTICKQGLWLYSLLQRTTKKLASRTQVLVKYQQTGGWTMVLTYSFCLRYHWHKFHWRMFPVAWVWPRVRQSEFVGDTHCGDLVSHVRVLQGKYKVT